MAPLTPRPMPDIRFRTPRPTSPAPPSYNTPEGLIPVVPERFVGLPPGYRRAPQPSGVTASPVTGPVPPPAGAPPPELTAEQRGVRATLAAVLGEFNLSSLADWVWEQYIGGSPVEQIFLDIRERPEWQAEYGASIGELAKQGIALNERQVIELRRQYLAVARSWNLPPGMYDSREDFDTFIARQLSPVELNDRLTERAAAATEWASSREGLSELVGREVQPGEEASVREELGRLYGVGPDDGSLVAYFIDPTRTLEVLRRQTAAARVGTVARRTGYATLSRSEAERVAATGVGTDEAQRRFAALGENVELFADLPGEASGAVSRDEQLAAAFEGNSRVNERIERRRQQRRGVFAGGGGFAGTRSGLGGLGSADT